MYSYALLVLERFHTLLGCVTPAMLLCVLCMLCMLIDTEDDTGSGFIVINGRTLLKYIFSLM